MLTDSPGNAGGVVPGADACVGNDEADAEAGAREEEGGGGAEEEEGGGGAGDEEEDKDEEEEIEEEKAEGALCPPFALGC